MANGAATYSIPIEVPPGIAGMQPEISLNYTSMGLNGIAGVGWSVSGLSSIERCNKTLAIDGRKQGIKFNSSDNAYCINGQRLINVGGSEFRTETESYSRITAQNLNWSNQSQFKVETKSGLTMYYGYHPENDTSIFSPNRFPAIVHWPVSRIEDRSGNYIHFKYGADSSRPYPIAIEYTGHANQAPTRRVEFNYLRTRPDLIQGYLGDDGFYGGVKFELTRLLKSIKTYVHNEPVQELNLFYKQQLSGATGRSRLASVQKCAVRGSQRQCVTPVSFDWQDPGSVTFSQDSADFQYRADTVIDSPDDVIVFDKTLGYPDLNGDGYVDVCKLYLNEVVDYKYLWDNFETERVYPTPMFAKCQLSTAAEFAAGEEIKTEIGNRNEALGGTKIYYALDTLDRNSPVGFGDIDGDLKQEVLVKKKVGSTAVIEVWRLNESTNELEVDASQQLTLLPSDNDNWDAIAFPDLDGDGRTDYCARYDDGIKCQLTTDAGFATGELIATGICHNDQGCGGSGGTLVRSTIQYVDVNADGLTDIAIRWNGGISAYSFNYDGTSGSFSAWSHTDLDDGINDQNGVCSESYCDYNNIPSIQYPDVNGDGLPELCYRSDSGVICYINIGKGWNTVHGVPIVTNVCYDTPPEVHEEWSCNYELAANLVKFADFNNDGKQDLVYRSRYGIRILISTGTSFVPTLLSNICSNTATGDGVCNGGSYETLQYLDLNNDGKIDILWEYKKFNSGGNRQGIGFVLSTQDMPDLITRISDSYNNEINIQYKGLNDDSVYSVSNNLWPDDPLESNASLISDPYPTPKIRIPFSVVSNVVSDDGKGGNRTLSYRYAAARVHNKGRGFLGFRSIEQRDDKTDRVTLTNFNQDITLDEGAYPLLGRVDNVTETVNGQTIKTVNNDWSFISSDKSRPYPYLKLTREESYDIPTGSAGSVKVASVETEVQVIGKYGNIWQTENRVYDRYNSLQFSTLTDSDYDNSAVNINAWTLGRLTNSSVTKKRYTGAALLSETRRSSFAYDSATGQLVTETVEPGGNANVTLTTSYK